MDYFLGNYKFKSDFDPKVVNNAFKEKKPINDIGFIYNCLFKQKKAISTKISIKLVAKYCRKLTQKNLF